jgi:acyl dehydratase
MAEAADSLITEQLKAWIGRTVGPMPLPERVSESDVRRYVNATGDRNPLWLDDEFARSAGYRARVVPPLMIAELYRRIAGSSGTHSDNVWEAMPLPEEYTQSRNAQAEFEWLEPVYVGDQLGVVFRIVDIVSRNTRAGVGIFITRELEFQREGGQVVVRVRQTSVKLPKRESSAGETGS